MRAPGNEDAVVIKKGKKAGEPHVITVNCPDMTGLSCDICRIVLDFDLYIKKGVLWVVPHYDSLILRWSHLKTQLVYVCPSCPTYFVLNLMSPSPASTSVYLLNFFCLDRTGLLHDVTQVTTTPDGRVLDLFFITDNLDLLHTKKRQDKTLEQFRFVLGSSCISCELKFAGPEYEYHQKIPSLSPAVPEELFMSEQLTDEEDNHAHALSDDIMKMNNSSVTVDNSLSPSSTLLQIRCVDHRGLLYDVLRTLKDFDVKISYGMFLPQTQGHRDVELFVQRTRSTELVVANPVELSGKGRPRVFYDVTLSLKVLGICVFSAEIRRYTASDREWEVYRFLLDEKCLFQLGSASARNEIANKFGYILTTSAGIMDHERSQEKKICWWQASFLVLVKAPILLHICSPRLVRNSNFFVRCLIAEQVSFFKTAFREANKDGQMNGILHTKRLEGDDLVHTYTRHIPLFSFRILPSSRFQFSSSLTIEYGLSYPSFEDVHVGYDFNSIELSQPVRRFLFFDSENSL
ncbi:hypothetical protein HA466_0225010 [Hirschfeldia incana]|nr:hypothetical protein HA466_0225010 [Hirschfeldia incana]